MAAQMRTDTGEKHTEAKRLGDIIVGARIETEDRVGIGVSAGQHDDRHLDPRLAHQTADFTAVHIRQTYIQQNEIDMMRAGEIEPGRAACHRSAGEFLMQLKLLRERTAQSVIVVDNKYFLCSIHLFSLYPSRSA